MIGWLFLLSTVMNPSSCQALQSGRIMGQDMAAALPAFQAIPRDAVIAVSPVAGSRRIFTTAELERIGRKYGISAAPGAQACFEWPLKPLTSEAVAASVRDTLQAPKAYVDILAVSDPLVPPGRLVFPISGLSVANVVDPSTPVTWRGYVAYGDSRRFDVWARVRASVTTTRIVAVENLVPDRSIQLKQVRMETFDDFPLNRSTAQSLDEVIGNVTRRAIRAGSPILRTDVAQPLLVRRGDSVEVTVISGRAEVRLNAEAENSGRQGETISFVNPKTGKTFQARVAGKGKAIVFAGLSASLVPIQ